MLNEYAVAHQHLGDPFQYGKLDRYYHAPLVNELVRFSSEAGISPRDVSGADYALTDFERNYLKGFKSHTANGTSGVLYIGAQDPPIPSRMRSSCGALLRNYISARFMLREELVYELWDRKRFPSFDFIAIPDLAVDDLPAAPKRSVSAWLIRRMSRGEQTAIGVSSTKVLRELLGPDSTHYMKHFTRLDGAITAAF